MEDEKKLTLSTFTRKEADKEYNSALPNEDELVEKMAKAYWKYASDWILGTSAETWEGLSETDKNAWENIVRNSLLPLINSYVLKAQQATAREIFAEVELLTNGFPFEKLTTLNSYQSLKSKYGGKIE